MRSSANKDVKACLAGLGEGCFGVLPAAEGARAIAGKIDAYQRHAARSVAADVVEKFVVEYLRDIAAQRIGPGGRTRLRDNVIELQRATDEHGAFGLRSGASA